MHVCIYMCGRCFSSQNTQQYWVKYNHICIYIHIYIHIHIHTHECTVVIINFGKNTQDVTMRKEQNFRAISQELNLHQSEKQNAWSLNSYIWKKNGALKGGAGPGIFLHSCLARNAKKFVQLSLGSEQGIKVLRSPPKMRKHQPALTSEASYVYCSTVQESPSRGINIMWSHRSSSTEVPCRNKSSMPIYMPSPLTVSFLTFVHGYVFVE